MFAFKFHTSPAANAAVPAVNTTCDADRPVNSPDGWLLDEVPTLNTDESFTATAGPPHGARLPWTHEVLDADARDRERLPAVVNDVHEKRRIGGHIELEPERDLQLRSVAPVWQNSNHSRHQAGESPKRTQHAGHDVDWRQHEGIIPRGACVREGDRARAQAAVTLLRLAERGPQLLDPVRQRLLADV
jgi:hypothetical protein